jgi:hypothetical protein
MALPRGELLRGSLAVAAKRAGQVTRATKARPRPQPGWADAEGQRLGRRSSAAQAARDGSPAGGADCPGPVTRHTLRRRTTLKKWDGARLLGRGWLQVYAEVGAAVEAVAEVTVDRGPSVTRPPASPTSSAPAGPAAVTGRAACSELELRP